MTRRNLSKIFVQVFFRKARSLPRDNPLAIHVGEQAHSLLVGRKNVRNARQS
jgi:hypothetical protein